MSENTNIRITVTNTSGPGGTAVTPFWFGFHDGSFDLFESGAEASDGLEALAEDGNADGLGTEVVGADADAQSGIIPGVAGPIATGETTSTVVSVDGESNGSISLAAMVLPSNDAFVGTGDAVELFDETGNFLGAQTIVFEGSDVYDAGTEYNTEEDAAFINQTAPNTGLDENGVVRQHEGFNGSEGNPDGELGNPDGSPGEQIILGGTNAFGETVDPVAADFTREGATIAEIHINAATIREGTDDGDWITGDATDDLVTAGGGNDVVFGRRGYDVVDGGDGRDTIVGGQGNDELFGGDDDDFVFGGKGNDVVGGGTGNDVVGLGSGDDTVVFSSGDGFDVVLGFDSTDLLVLDIGVTDIDELAEFATEVEAGILLNFGDGDSMLFVGLEFGDVNEDNVLLLG